MRLKLIAFGLGTPAALAQDAPAADEGAAERPCEPG
jgi:hypothetical protein